MKKIAILLGIVAMYSCTCRIAISQVPPQYLLVDENCQAVLPDYTTDEYITVTDNCGIKSKIQTPSPGYVLTAVNQTVTVVIRATDNFGNFSEVSFTVTAKDEQPPTITPTGKLIADNWNVINSMYDTADRLTAEQEAYFDAHFDWEAAGIPVDMRPVDQYNKKVLSIMTPPAYVFTKEGTRFFLFESNKDTYIAK